MKSLMFSLILGWAAIATADVPVHEDRNETEYNWQFDVALDGYDPVSYFSEGGGVPAEGSASISFTYGTVKYHFTSVANRNLFKSNPLKYEPTYGSWCAYAMSQNAKVTVQPHVFTLHNGRLHVFATNSAKKKFDADLVDLEVQADLNWMEYSGEAPRL